MFTVTLFEPQIPPNTGNIARLCAATGTRLEIVGKIGFELTDRYLKRAGLDYWDHVNWEYFPDAEKYMLNLDVNKIHLLSSKVTKPYTTVPMKDGDYLIFGSETHGIDKRYMDLYKEQCCTIPMKKGGVRCLNLSSSAAIVLYEALRQNDWKTFGGLSQADI